MSRPTRIQQNGQPRTKGIRNPLVAYATFGCKGGSHKNPRDKRAAQKERRYEAAAG
jgi:hypothetical protein